MTITITGPDSSTFEFPDDTAPDVIKGAMAKHYGAPTEAAPAHDVSAISAATGLPVIGAYAPKAAGWLRHLAQGGTTAERTKEIQDEIAAYEQAHPVASTVGKLAIGSIPYALAPELGGARVAQALGMTGPLKTAALAGGASGGLIGLVDAAARGEDPTTGLAVGALTGAGGPVIGKGVGRLWDAARGIWVDRPRIPNVRQVAGVDVPISEGVATGDAKLQAEEQGLLGTQHPIATAAEANTNAAMKQAHSNLIDQLGTQGTAAPGMAREAGDVAAGDLVRQEQARAQAEVQRMAGARADTAQLAGQLGGGGPLTSLADVGQYLGQRLRELGTAARERTRQAYGAASQVPAAYNPNMMRNVGDTVLGIVNSEPGVTRVTARNTPAAYGAIQGIDEEIQAQMALAAQRGRQFGPMEMEAVRQTLVDAQADAIGAARMSGNYKDVRAIARVKEAFDQFEQQLVQRPSSIVTDPTGQWRTAPGGLLSGDAQQILATRAAARAAHAQERQVFGRQGPGDVVGTFMGTNMGRFPGQEMSPEKFISSILGKPGGAIPENAVPILNHLRDRVFGANSQEWAAIKRAVVQNMADTPAGGAQVGLTELADRIDKFLGNPRHANAVLSPQEQTQLRIHSQALRAAEPVAPQARTIEHLADQLAGRGGIRPATGAEIITRLKQAGGGDLAVELARRLPPETMGQIRQGIVREVLEGPRGAIDWKDQKISTSIANFLKSDLAPKLLAPNDLAVLQSIGDLHKRLIPLPRTTNPSGSGYEVRRMAKGLSKQLLKMVLGTVHGVPGYIAGEGLGKGIERLDEKQIARRAMDLFQGRKAQLPRQGDYYPQRVGAFAGRLAATDTQRSQ